MLYFGFGLAFISARRMADYEHLPRPKDKSRKLRWFFQNSPMYLRLVLTQRLRRLFAGDPLAPATENGKQILKTIVSNGAMDLSLTGDQLREMREILAPHFKRLEERLAQKAPEDRKFDETRLAMDPDSYPDIYRWFNEAMRQAGVLEAASAYLGRQVSLAQLAPQINDPTDNFWSNHFSDVGVEDSPCDYCHVDATYNVLKMIVYVNEVGADNGPFSYVVGSHRAAARFWDGMIRRANDYAGLSWTRQPYRRLFYALPRTLQRKGAFGADLASDNRYIPAILDNEQYFTTETGNGILFDPGGIHRGGMVQQGRRLAVGIMLAELAQ